MPKLPKYVETRPIECFGLGEHVTRVIALLLLRDDRSRQKIREPRRDPDRPRARSAAAMGRGEGLVQIVVHHVEAEIARPRDAGKRVHIGAVAVDEPAAVMHQAHDLLDVLLEQAERVGIGHHDAGDGVVAGHSHRLEIDIAARIRGQLDRGKSGHGGGGRIGAVRRIGDEDARAPEVAARTMIGAHHQQPGELAMRAGRGLQRNRRKAADLGEPLLQLVHQREVALHRLRFLQRMGFREGRQPRDLLVDLRIVFHGAGAERIESAIDTEIALRERKIMPHHVEFCDSSGSRQSARKSAAGSGASGTSGAGRSRPRRPETLSS